MTVTVCVARRLEQIIHLRNRFAIPQMDVNLLYLFDVERIHTIGVNRQAVLANRDPLQAAGTALSRRQGRYRRRGAPC